MAKDKKTKKKKFQYATTKDRMDNREQKGGKSVLKIPEGVKRYKLEKEGKELLDVMAFIAGEGNNAVDPGIAYWEKTYFVHPDVGPNQATVVCNARTFDKPCPICEKRVEMQKEGAEKDDVKPLYPKQKQAFLVTDRKNKEDGIQVFETYGYTKDGTAFGERLDAKLEAVSDEPDHPYHSFWHLENGMTLQVMAKKQTMPNGSFIAAGNIELLPRKSQYKDEMLEEIPCLDDMVEEADYDEVKALFLGEEVEEEEKPKGKKDKTKKKTKKKEEDEDEDDQEDDEEEENGDDEESDDSDDDEDSEEEDEEEQQEGEDEDGDQFAVGDSVTFKYKGKVREGEIVKINKKKDPNILSVQTEDKDDPFAVAADDKTLKKVEEEDEDEDDTEDEDDSPLDGEDEEEEEEEEEKPKKKVKRGKMRMGISLP
jgi:hypothetical protein